MASAKSKLKVAVIGAGAAGLCAGRHLQAEPEQFVFDIFEQQDAVGGTWKYSERVGHDEYGLPVHSSVYKNLKTNLPKEVMAFPDFPFPHCDGQSFLHHTQILQYLEDYAQHYELYRFINFHKLIENVKPLKHSSGRIEWSVSFSDVVTKERETRLYDAVMVCNGHYSVPYVPEIPGLNEFKGVLLHSHDYRDPADFKDMRIVVLGAGASGIDVALEIAGYAKEVILSHNLSNMTCPLPENLKQERGIKYIGESSVTLLDEKKYECDTIILCTGYLYDYPFLDSSCNVEVHDQRVSNLYLHTFHIDHPTLSIWAVSKLILPFPIYDQQVRVFLKFLKGIITLPDPDVMRAETEKDFERRLEAGFKRKHAHILPEEWQWEFDDELCKLGNIKPIPEVVRNLFRHTATIKKKDIMNYKQVTFNIVNGETFTQNE